MLLAAILMAQAPNPTLMLAVRSAIPVGDKMAILRPAELAIGGRVVKYAWSTDGKTVLVFRQDTVKSNEDWLAAMQSTGQNMSPAARDQPDGLTVEAWEYNVDRRTATKVFRAPADTWRPYQITPIPHSSAFLFTGQAKGDGTPGDFASYFVSGAGKLTVLSGVNDGIADSQVSEQTGLVTYSVGEFKEGQFSNWRGGIIGPNGVLKRMAMPEGFRALIWWVDGKRAVAVVSLTVRDQKTKKREQYNWVDWDRQTLTPFDETAEMKKAMAPGGSGIEGMATPDNGEVAKKGVTSETVSVPVGKKQANLTASILFSEGDYGLIAADVSDATVSLDWQSVAFVAHGSLFVKPIVLVDKATFGEWMEKLAREESMSIAKQVGLAMLMYAGDMDDELPSPKTDWQKTIEPYIKNKDMIGRFVYSFKGGNAANVKEPANEIMGFVPGPGGRSVTYMDGHVKWVKN